MTTLKEQVNMEVLRVIRDNAEEVFDRMGRRFKRFNPESHQYEVSEDAKAFVKIMNDYYKGKQASDTVKYGFSVRSTDGRRFSKTISLQGLPRSIRHSLSDGIYEDWDMVNAHPTILLQYCRSENYEHLPLEAYVTRRDKVLEKVVGYQYEFPVWKDGFYSTESREIKTRSDAKQAILAILNGGGNGNTGNDVLDNFYKTQADFLAAFCKKPENHKYYERARRTSKEKGSFNIQGRALNYYLCEKENEILVRIEDELRSRNVSYGALCFDGLMVYQKDVYPGLLEEINEALSTYHISLSVKPMDEGVNLSGLEVAKDIDLSDRGLAQEYLRRVDGNILYSRKRKEVYRFNERTALWNDYDLSSIITDLYEVLESYVRRCPDPDLCGQILDSLVSSRGSDNVIRMIKAFIKTRDDDVIIREFNRKVRVFPICESQVFDFVKGEPRQRVKEDYFKGSESKFPNRYLILSDDQKKHVVDYFTAMLTKISEETGETVHPSFEYVKSMILAYALTLTGEFNAVYKKIIFLLGQTGDNGKSTFIDLIALIHGVFAVKMDPSIYEENKSKAVHQAAMIPLMWARFAYTSEIDEKRDLAETMLKGISGNDSQSIRDSGARGDSIETYHFLCAISIACNALPQIRGAPFLNRIMAYMCKNKFEKNDQYRTNMLSDESRDIFFSYLCDVAHQHYKDKTKVLIPQEVVRDAQEIWCDRESVASFAKSAKEGYVFEEDRQLSADKLYDDYLNYCKANSFTSPEGKTTFRRRIEELWNLPKPRKLTNEKTSQREQMYEGIGEEE